MTNYDPKPFSDEPPPLPPSGEPRKDQAPEFVEAEIYEPTVHAGGATAPWSEPPPLPPPIVAGPLQASHPAASKATTAMVLGIVSCAVFCFCYGIPSIVCGIMAIVYSGQARRELAEGPPNAAAAKHASIGRTCGIIGIVLSVLMLVIGVVYVIAMVAMETSRTR